MIHSHVYIWLLALDLNLVPQIVEQFCSATTSVRVVPHRACVNSSLCHKLRLIKSPSATYFPDDLQGARHWLKSPLLWGSGVGSCWISCKWVNPDFSQRKGSMLILVYIPSILLGEWHHVNISWGSLFLHWKTLSCLSECYSFSFCSDSWRISMSLRVK